MCPTLGDFLPDKLKEGFTDRNLVKGCVLRLYCNNAEKIKIITYLDLNYDKSLIGFLYINSEINLNLYPTTELQSEHYLLLRENYDFLEKDSFVNCTDFITWPTKKIIDLLDKDIKIHIGCLSEYDYNCIRKKVVSSKVMTPRDKKNFGCYFS
jgi:hypothetical protein